MRKPKSKTFTGKSKRQRSYINKTAIRRMRKRQLMFEMVSITVTDVVGAGLVAFA